MNELLEKIEWLRRWQRTGEIRTAKGRSSDDLSTLINQIEIAAKKIPNILQLEAERLEWSLKTFPEATAGSSLQKLKDEINEVELHIALPPSNKKDTREEYADCLMCLFDSAGRLGITPEQIFDAFAFKLKKNKARTWVKNENNTYSHVKN